MNTREWPCGVFIGNWNNNGQRSEDKRSTRLLLSWEGANKKRIWSPPRIWAVVNPLELEGDRSKLVLAKGKWSETWTNWKWIASEQQFDPHQESERLWPPPKLGWWVIKINPHQNLLLSWEGASKKLMWSPLGNWAVVTPTKTRRWVIEIGPHQRKVERHLK